MSITSPMPKRDPAEIAGISTGWGVTDKEEYLNRLWKEVNDVY
jgi:hypothetical protein